MSNRAESKLSASVISIGFDPDLLSSNMTTRTFYRGYLLSSNPMALDDGRFQARVAITALSSDKTLAQRFLDLDAFASRDEAVQQAIRSGMEWIDTNNRSSV